MDRLVSPKDWIPATTDLNDCKTTGAWSVTGGAPNGPGDANCTLIVLSTSRTGTRVLQVAIAHGSNNVHIRHYVNAE